jgi:hypothetical protein
MSGIPFFFTWCPALLAGSLVVASLAQPGQVLAQTIPDSTGAKAPARADTAAAPVVASSSSGASGLPSSEFETYNVNGKGIRYTAALTGIYSTGTVERIYITTSHTGSLALG